MGRFRTVWFWLRQCIKPTLELQSYCSHSAQVMQSPKADLNVLAPFSYEFLLTGGRVFTGDGGLTVVGFGVRTIIGCWRM